MRALADGGDTWQMLGLAYIRLNPKEPRYNPEEAAIYLQKAADARFELAKLFEKGLGLTADPVKALDLFRRAADLRHPEAMFNYAGLIDEGLVPDKTPDDTAKYLYQALRTGSDQVLTQPTTRPDMFKAPARKALQKILKKHSFYLGPLDGDFGKNTKPPSKKPSACPADQSQRSPRQRHCARSSQSDTAPRPEPNFPHRRFKNIPRGNAALGPSTNAALGV